MRRNLRHPVLTPVAFGLLVAFPFCAAGQAPVPRPAAPVANAVPRPMPGWRIYGTGAAAPANRGNAAGGTDQTIDQSSARGIYNWQSFDIGSASSVTFSFATKDSSALNRVLGNAGPSQIFGALRSQYANPTAGEAPLTGGSIYLINANGILFGRGAQVNTGALIASTLNLTDADFASGLTNSIAGKAPSFRYEGSPEFFTDARNFVLVDPGASITTASGGRVFLFAKNVQNAGSISTPDGQAVLAAGSEVYLGDPTREPLYASEVNSNYPVLRGLLVEVGGGAGGASNLAGGSIDAARGNVTLVGMAVNQQGRISATTSVSANGSVFLLARGNAQPQINLAGEVVKRATTSGALTLGVGSSIEIAPDKTAGSDGKVPTSDGSSIFTASRVELAGKTIELQAGASIVAPGGVVNARAEVVPNYIADAVRQGGFGDADKSARLVVGEGATIDVSGTDSTLVSVARNFVTTELLGASDLKDAPLQKDGPLYRSRVTFDVRKPVAILGDTSTYGNAIKRTAEERLSAGGRIALSSTGSLVTNPTSKLDVSGGTVTYSDAIVKPTLLVAADGSTTTLNNATATTQYSAIQGGGPVTIDRWGVVPRWTPAQSDTGRVELGYVEGRAGGNLSLVAPVEVLDGQLAAATVSGVRQQSGIDPLAARGQVALGTRQSGVGLIPFGSPNFRTAGLIDLTITGSTDTLSAAYWAAPLEGALPTVSRIAASTLEASGLGQLTVTTDGRLVIADGADLALAPGSSVSLAAGGAGGLTIGGSFRSVGGSFSARAADLLGGSVNGPTVSGALTLKPGQTIDVAGDWQNAFLDGPTTRSAFAGGTVSLTASHSLDLQDTSRIDVSGGGTVRSNGSVVGTNAGSITLQGNNTLANAGVVPSRIHIGATLKGQSLAGGGTLSVKAADITIGSRAIPRGIADGPTPGSLVLSEAYFDNGGFTSYRLDAARSLDVIDGTTIAPRASNWVATADMRDVATGTRPASFLQEALLPDSLRRPVNLTLTANSPFAVPFGDLTIGAGARIDVDPRANVTLQAGRNLDVQGSIRAPGGNISLALASASAVTEPVSGTLRVGERAVIDASGTVVLKVPDGGPPRGEVVAGGGIGIVSGSGATALAQVDVRPGSVLAADGASARLAVDIVTPASAVSTEVRTLASEGGSISITATNGGASLAGTMHARGGDDTTAGGRFTLSLNIPRPDPTLPTTGDVFDRAVRVQQAPVTTVNTVPGTTLLSSRSLSDGFSDLSITAPDHITFNGSVDLAMARSLVLDTPALQALPGSRVTLSGGSLARIGGTPDGAFTAAPIAGSASLRVEGGLVELFGSQVLQGIGTVEMTSASELRLQSVPLGTGQAGRFAALADVTLNAAQVTPTTGSIFTLSAPGHMVTIAGGDATRPAPLSAGGSITINADTIVQDGVLRAPFGSIALNATRAVVLGETSLTSVSGAGLAVPFGATTGAANWSYLGSPVAAPVAKTIDLQAPGQSIDVRPGAKVDLSGGGALLAFEFVPGTGGSTDVFAAASGGAFAVVPTVKSYAPQDADIQSLAGNSASAFPLGRQVTFGPGGPIPAGTYAVLPPRYATLAGAFLVKPGSATTSFDLGASIAQADGSTLVGGIFSSAGTPFAASLPSTLQVIPSAVALRSSEIRRADANDYFTAQARSAGTVVPRLPIDAGRLNAVADAQSLKGDFDFGLPADPRARGGEFDVAAARIRVGSGGSATQPGVLTLDVAELNAAGAALLVIGGSRSGADGQSLDVVASEVVVDNQGTPLKGSDIVIAATGRVQLAAGAAIQASGSASSGNLSVDGDGALLRLNGDPTATTVRTGVGRTTGDLVIANGASLMAPSIIAEATRSTVIGEAAVVQAAQSLTIGASRMAVGSVDAATAGANTLILTPDLVARFGQTQSLSLRSFDGIDFHGTSSLGGGPLASLTLDAGNLRLVGANANATISAGKVQLTNSSNVVSATTAGSGTLTVRADGGAAGSGGLSIGPGSVGISGAAATTLAAAHDVTLGTSQLAVSGDLTIRAPVLLAAASANASIAAAGAFTLDSQGATPAAGGGAGAHVSVGARSIVQAGNIVLPSGELTLEAAGAPAADSITFGANSSTDLSGRLRLIDGVAIATPGGDLRVSTQTGNVVAVAGSVLDVSAADAGAGRAGSISIAATGGSATLAGRLRATSGSASSSGSLLVDSATPLALAQLAATISAERTATRANFGDTLDIRNRTGDQIVAAGGPGLSAAHISIASDAGSLDVSGSLRASGVAEPSIQLAGGKALNILPGAQLAANGTGAQGGLVSLSSGTGLGGPNGTLSLTGGAIDVGAAAGGKDGVVLIRAQRSDSGDDVRIGSIGTQIAGARQVEVEAVARYTASVVDGTLIDAINADNDAFAGVGGSNAAAIVARLAGGNAVLADKLRLRAGVEVDSSGDMLVAGDPNFRGWNLTRFGDDGQAQAQPSGAPINLSLRAAGNLNVASSISDGFSPAGEAPPQSSFEALQILPAAVIVPGEGGRIRLVGGADLSAANVLATVSSAARGDVVIGASGTDVVVRTTTGTVDVAAGRDVRMLNRQAAAYTTGTPVTGAGLAGYVGNRLITEAYLGAGEPQTPFLEGGGSLSVRAQRDVLGASGAPAQYATEWLWASGDLRPNVGAPLWYSRYDVFNQGFATFGGGGAEVRAGRDAINAEVSAATSAFVPRLADGSLGTRRLFGGGDVALVARRDVVGGFSFAGSGTQLVSAGRNVQTAASLPALQLIVGETATVVEARNNADVGRATPIGMVGVTAQYASGGSGIAVTGTAPDSSLSILAAAGDLTYRSRSITGNGQATALRHFDLNGNQGQVIPDFARFAAPDGAVNLGALIQTPANDGLLEAVAGKGLSTTGQVVVTTTSGASRAPGLVTDSQTLSDLITAFVPGTALLDASQRSPVQLVAAGGDLRLGSTVSVARPVRLIASGDIVAGALGGPGRIEAQHQSDREVSLIQAGRDIVLPATNTASGEDLKVHGPGDLLVLAGRSIDLRTSGGVGALGNRENAALPAGSATVTIMAGVDPSSRDGTQATAWFFPLLGGTGVAGYAPDLAAQLQAAAAGQASPGLGSAAAAAFKALTVEQQVASARQIVGDATFDLALLTAMRRIDANPSLDIAAATAAFAKLADADKAGIVGAALADGWTARIPVGEQNVQALAMAALQGKGNNFAAALTSYTSRVTGSSLTPEQALAAFQALPVERRIIFTNAVLVDQVRQAGRAASSLGGTEREAAYAKAYAAIDTVFPEVGGSGDIRMGSSQVRSFQDSGLAMTTPRGGVNVGELSAGSSAKSASVLGIVTAAGGDISLIVRDSVAVNQSRVFTVGEGDLLMWASDGNLDAGRGAKTVTGAPPPLFRFDANGNFVIDTSGSFTGSGIAVLDASSTLDLYAPKGEINAGDAGIKSLGNAFLGAARFVGADNLAVSGVAVGAPPPAPTGGATAGLAGAAGAAAAAQTRITADDSEEEKERKRRRRLNLILEFLGFGDGAAAKP